MMNHDWMGTGMGDAMRGASAPDYEDAREAVALARECARAPSASLRAARWACDALAPACSDDVAARAGNRIAFLSKAAGSLAPIGEDRGAWLAAGRAQGWADALGQGDRAASAAASWIGTAAAGYAEAAIVRKVFQLACFDVIGQEEAESRETALGLKAWLDGVCARLGGLGPIAAGHAFIGLREGFEEASAEQGAGESDLARAKAFAGMLGAGWSEARVAGARTEYGAHGDPADPFREDFQP